MQDLCSQCESPLGHHRPFDTLCPDCRDMSYTPRCDNCDIATDTTFCETCTMDLCQHCNTSAEHTRLDESLTWNRD